MISYYNFKNHFIGCSDNSIKMGKIISLFQDKQYDYTRLRLMSGLRHHCILKMLKMFYTACLHAPYTSNEINSEKNTKPIRNFQLSLGGKHLLKLTTFTVKSIILYLFACWLYRIIAIHVTKPLTTSRQIWRNPMVG